MITKEDHDPSSKIVLFLIFFIFGCITFYQIGLKPLWLDEILVPLTSRFPLGYIIERSLVTDFHPPGFYLIIKLWSIISSSDGFLRTFSVLCAMIGIYMMYRVGSVICSGNVGLLSAALLASNMLFISLSRQVRPYSLLVLLYCLATYGYFSFRKYGERGSVFLLSISVLPLIHYSAILVLCAMMIFMAYDWRCSTALVKKYKWNSISVVVAWILALVLLFFRMSEAGSPGTVMGTMLNVLKNLCLVSSWSDGVDAFSLAAACLLFCGICVLFRTNKDAAIFFSMYALIPVFILVAARYSSYSNPWHYSYFIVFFSCVCAVCIDSVLRSRRMLVNVVACLIIVLGVSRVYKERVQLYSSESEGGKQYEQVLSTLFTKNFSFVVGDQMQFHAVERYIPQEKRAGYLRQAVSSDSDSLDVICGDKGCADRAFGGERVELLEGGMSRVRLKRHPVIDLFGYPETIKIKLDPVGFYSTVRMSEYVQLDVSSGSRVIPTINEGKAFFEYRVQPSHERYPYIVCVLLRYEVKSRGSRLNVYSKVDSGEQKLLYSAGYDAYKEVVPLYLVFDRSFSTLDIMVEMECAKDSPRFPGGNLQTVCVKDMTLYFGGYRSDK
ncbi:MAG: glycosyltransferase family 39 protein [Desulfovibrio sp.]|nr:glycosyltransferase family 39 protein [Desulfovibrio sp.]MBI4960262.1 glycosyltransferase family 39 protein [Desulfovibrio sp.]